jgi:hypothetical protein
MKRLCATLWLPLLVALFAGSSVASGRGSVWSDAAGVRSSAVDAAPDGFVRSAAEWHHTLDARLRKDQPPHPRAGLLPQTASAPSCTHQLGSLTHRDRDTVTGQSCHHPLFPTGPPPHA